MGNALPLPTYAQCPGSETPRPAELEPSWRSAEPVAAKQQGGAADGVDAIRADVEFGHGFAIVIGNAGTREERLVVIGPTWAVSASTRAIRDISLNAIEAGKACLRALYTEHGTRQDAFARAMPLCVGNAMLAAITARVAAIARLPPAVAVDEDRAPTGGAATAAAVGANTQDLMRAAYNQDDAPPPAAGADAPHAL